MFGEQLADGFRWSQFDMRNWGLDSEKSAHAEDQGSRVAEYVLPLLAAHGVTFGPEARYLGFGAGMALAELAFAKALGIAPHRTVLLDRNFGLEAIKRIRTASPETITLDSIGIREFLEKPSIQGFAVTTLFGLDHKLRKQIIPNIASNMPKVLSPNGVVCIYPGGPSGEHWERHNFMTVSDGNPQVFVFRPR